MRHNLLFVSSAFAIALAATACGGGEVTVRVLTEGAEGELQPEENLVLDFLPYDRDSVFDVLTERAAEPEPRIPEELRAAFDSVRVLQEEWREADTEWAEVRDELKRLSDRLQGMDPRSREYRQLFDRFNSLEGRERALDRRKTQAFDAFTALQQSVLARRDSVQAVYEAWADVAFEEYLAIEDSILEAMGREVYQDTTDAEGTVTRRLPGGAWWVHTRIPVGMFDELYWNERFQPGGVDTLPLTPQNAERRLRL